MKTYYFSVELWGTEIYEGEMEAESKEEVVAEIEENIAYYVDNEEERGKL